MQSDAETSLSPAQSRDLRRIAGLMIPASEEFGIPGADDAAIFADIERSLGRDRGEVCAALQRLAALSDGAFAALDDARADTVAEAFLAHATSEVTTLGRVVLQCYYRDDRVVRSLGLEPRAPYPQGNPLEQGDWSLLEMVRARPQMWRDAP